MLHTLLQCKSDSKSFEERAFNTQQGRSLMNKTSHLLFCFKISLLTEQETVKNTKRLGKSKCRSTVCGKGGVCDETLLCSRNRRILVHSTIISWYDICCYVCLLCSIVVLVIEL